MAGRILLSLYDEFGATRANMTDIQWAWWSPGNAVDGSDPVDFGVGETTDASGLIAIDVADPGMGDLALTDGINFALYAEVTAFDPDGNYPNDGYTGWVYDGTAWNCTNLRNGAALKITRLSDGIPASGLKYEGAVDSVVQVVPAFSWQATSWQGMQSYLKRTGVPGS